MFRDEKEKQLKEVREQLKNLQAELNEANSGFVALSMEFEQRVEERTRELHDLTTQLEVEITEKEQQQGLIERLLKQQIAANELTLALGNAIDLKEIYHIMYRHISQVMDTSAFTVSSYDPSNDKITFDFYLLEGQEIDIKKLPYLPIEDKGCGTQSVVIREGQPVIINDYQEKFKTVKHQYYLSRSGELIKGAPSGKPDEAVIQSAVCVPLIEKDKVIGVLQVQSFEKNAYNDEDIEILGSMAGVASIAIQNARLVVLEQKRQQIANTLVKTAGALSSTLDQDEVLRLILSQLQQVIHYDSATVQLLEGNKVRNVVASGFEDEQGVLELTYSLNPSTPNYKVIKNKTPVAYENVSDHFPIFKERADMYQSGHICTWLGIPLIIKDEAVGMITADRKVCMPYTEEEKILAMAFASQAASAIENTQLYKDTRKRISRLNALRDIDQAISGSFDLRVTLNIILNKVLEQLGVDASMVLVYNEDMKTLEAVSYVGFNHFNVIDPNIRMGEGHAGRAALERSVIHLSDPQRIREGFEKYPAILEEGFVEYYALPLEAKGKVLGVLELFSRKLLLVKPDWHEFMRTLTRQAAIAVDNMNQFENLQKMNTTLVMTYDETLEGWAKTLELRDPQNMGHADRVSTNAVKLARSLGMSEPDIVHLRRGALLHDVGKIGVPDRILRKPGPLDDEEWELVKKHPVYAYELLSSVNFLKPVLDIPRYHHERWDGMGYPRGLKGKDIPLMARIVSVVNVFDALCMDRPYRTAWTHEKALQHIREQSGKAFDPLVVQVFINNILPEITARK